MPKSCPVSAAEPQEGAGAVPRACAGGKSARRRANEAAPGFHGVSRLLCEPSQARLSSKLPKEEPDPLDSTRHSSSRPGAGAEPLKAEQQQSSHVTQPTSSQCSAAPETVTNTPHPALGAVRGTAENLAVQFSLHPRSGKSAALSQSRWI